jgi:hypothetical protein
MSAVTDLKVAAIADRAKNILMTPAPEWDKIAGEAPTLQDLFLRYVAVLAVIPAVSGFVGHLAFGLGARWAFKSLVMGYVMSFVGPAISGFAADYLAPHFGGKSDRNNAFKLTVYSMTAAWLAGIFSLVPALSILGIAGLYSIYLFYIGAPKLMKITPENAMTYTAAVTIVSLMACGLVSMFMILT